MNASWAWPWAEWHRPRKYHAWPDVGSAPMERLSSSMAFEVESASLEREEEEEEEEEGAVW